MPWSCLETRYLDSFVDFLQKKEYNCMSFSDYIRSSLSGGGNYFNRTRIKHDNIVIHTDEDSNIIDFSIMLTPSGQLLLMSGSSALNSSFKIRTGLDMIRNLGKRINLVMGEKSCVERVFASISASPGSRSAIDYHTMVLDRNNFKDFYSFEDLEFRTPLESDFEVLKFMQKNYEKEEVLLVPQLFNRRESEENLIKMLEEQTVIVAVYRGKAAAKANTNCIGFRHEQIGGVYTFPEYRNLGISTAVTAVLCRSIFSRGKKPSLFVKENNSPAIRVYEKAGFKKTGDLRIVYQ